MRIAAALIFLALVVSACDHGSQRSSSTDTEAVASTEAVYKGEWPADGEAFVRQLIEQDFQGARQVVVNCGSIQANVGSCDVTWRGADGENCNASMSLRVSGPHPFDRSRTHGMGTCTGAADFDFAASP